MGQSVRRARNPLASGVGRVKFTVGAEASNTIRVTASLKAPNRADEKPAARQAAQVYLTQNLTTLAVAGTAPATSVAVGGGKGTVVVTHTAKLAFLCTFDANGELALDVAETGAATWYLVVVLGGEVFVSPAVTFA
jgi:hypothetical protein